MNPIKSIFLTLLIALTSTVFANDNIFLDRSYWNGKPTLVDVKEKSEAGNDPTQLNEHGFDPLVYALLENASYEVLEYLIGLDGNDVNKITHDGRTYIFWAAYKGNLRFMKTLVEMGASTAHIDDHGYSIMNFAAVAGQEKPDLYDFLIENGADVKAEKDSNGANTLLLLSPHLKSKDMVNYFVKKGLSLDDVDKYGNGLFNYAAAGGNVDMLKWLVRSGVSSQAGSVDGRNAMHFAAKGMRGHSNGVEVYEYLLTQRNNPLQPDSKRNTPVMIAAKSTKHTSVINFFNDRGANLDKSNTSGRTALMNAAQYNDIRIVEAILAEVDDVNKVDNDGQSALTYAVRYNTTEVVKALIEAGANIYVTDQDGNGLMNYLVESFSPSNEIDYMSKSRLLIESGLSLLDKDEAGNNLFHLAAQQDALPILKQAHEMNLDVNAKNHDGMTPLLIAAMKSSSTETLKYLVEIGADPSVRTEFEESACDLAKENELLRTEGGNIEFLQY